MKKILPLLFILSTIIIDASAQAKTNGAISAQIKTLKAEKYLTVDYNKSAGVTKILGFGEDFGREQNKKNNLSAFSFGITFNYAGEQFAAAPETFLMTFWAKSDKPKFAGSHSLKVIIVTEGGTSETLDFGEARYATKASEKGMEFLNFVVSRENIRKIADSRSENVRLIIGNSEFKFTHLHLKLFRDLLEISSLS